MFRLALTTLLLFFSASIANATVQTDPIRILLIGDSLTSGYNIQENKAFASILEQKLMSDGYSVEIINMSMDGQTSGNARKQLDTLTLHNPDIVIVQLGLHDAYRRIDLKHMLHRNLYYIIRPFHHKGTSTLIIGVDPPSGTPQNYANTMRHIYKEISRHYAAWLYPDFLESIRGRPELTLADGVHPNEDGVLAMVHAAYPYIEPLVVYRINLQIHKNSTK